MAIKIQFDVDHNPILPTLILANRNGNKLGVISGAYSVQLSDALSETPTMSFKVSKNDNLAIQPLWDSIEDLKLVWCKEWDFWFEIRVELEDAEDTIKSVECTALCQSELSQVNLYDIQINTEVDIEREEYVIPTVLYDPVHPEASLLMRITEKVPHYKIEHVDETIAYLQRTFEFNATTIVDALNDIAEEIGALVVYGNGSVEDPQGKLGQIPARTISLYDLETTCLSCGHRGEFVGKCPKCGSTSFNEGYGEDTTIFVSNDNLTDSVVVETDIDSVKNCFHLVAGDDLMTATVRNCNPNGSGYIWYISDDVMRDMPDELIEKLKSYQNDYQYYSNTYPCNISAVQVSAYNSLVDKYSSYRNDLKKITTPITGYSNLMNALYDTIDFSLYLSDSFMPTPESNRTTASDQVKMLTVANLSPCAVTSIDVATKTTVDLTVVSMAKIFVARNYQVKVGNSSYNNVTHVWTGTLIVQNYSDDEDTATTGQLTINITGSYEKYVRQMLDKTLKNREIEDYSVTALFGKSLNEFASELKKYGLSMLTEFHECCQVCLDVLVEQGISDGKTWGAETPNLYNKFYVDYLNKMSKIEAETAIRDNEIKTIDTLMGLMEKEKAFIQDKLDFQKHIGETYWKQFCAYRREDEYSNSNYISDGLTNAELFSKAREFLDVAENEIYKSANLQLHISSTLDNLLVIKEFEKLLNYFEVGNWLRIEADGVIYKLRLIKYEIDFDSLSELSVEFSDILKVADAKNEVKDILDKASSMASSYSSVEKQASRGEQTSKYVDTWFKDGLDATLTRIVNNAENQDIVWDSHGMLFRKYDDILQGYSPQQLKIINSTIAVTDDNWETTKTAVGYFWYKDPRDGELKTAYGINGELVIGKLILGSSLSIFNSSGSLTFDDNGFVIKNGTNSFTVNPNSTQLLSLSKKEQGDIFWVDDKGTLHIVGDGAGLDITANDTTTKMFSSIQQNAEAITTKVGYGEIISSINQTPEEITIHAERISLEGIVTANDNFKILEDGSIEANNGKFNGTITVANGINTFTLDPNSPSGLMSLGKNSDDGLLWTDEDGMLHIVGDGKGIDITENDTVNDLYTNITITAEGIRSTVAKSQSKYDTTGYSITYYGYGSPSTDQYSAEISGRYYLDVGTGRLYQSLSGRWNPTSTYLPTVQSNVMSQIKQTGNNIAMIVSRSKYNRISDYSIDYYGYGVPSNSLYPPSENYSNRYFDIGSGWIYTVQYSYGSYSWAKHTQLTEIEYATTTYTDNSITNLVAENGKVQSMIRQELDNITISASKIKLEGYTTINGTFKIDSYGTMTATSGSFTGSVTATSISVKDTLSMYPTGYSSIEALGVTWQQDPDIGSKIYYLYLGKNNRRLYIGYDSTYDKLDSYTCITTLNTLVMNLHTQESINLQNSNGTSKITTGAEDNLIRYNCSGSNDAIWVGANPSYADNMFLSATNVYVGDSTGEKVTSDSRLKNNIESLANYKEFVMQLKPVKFKYNNGTSGRYHCGFEANAVEEAMLNSIGDFGIFVKRPKTLPNEECTVVDLNDDETYICSLRYNEFIAPHIALTQEHEREIITLKEEISELKNTIEQMKNKSVA